MQITDRTIIITGGASGLGAACIRAIVERGGIWLNNIYGVDLSTFSYETGFNTDLHEIAKQINDSHDSNYKF